jgi:phage/plasmid primase-like uncharacterized protein
MISRSRFEEAHAVDIRDVVARLGLRLKRVTVSELAGPCPRCGGKDRFSVNIRKGVFNCRGCSCGGDLIALCQHVRGLSFPEAIDFLVGERTFDRRISLRGVAATNRAHDERNSALALRMWHESVDPRGTLIETYLATRGLELPAEAAGDAIRFHPACPFGDVLSPAMVALVRNVVDDRPTAIHRTALTPEGQKREIGGKSRWALGPIAGGVIKLTPNADVTHCLGTGEGIETALSMREIAEFGRSPIWAAIYDGGLIAFPVLPVVETIWIAVDADDAGRRAASALGARYREAGREAFLIEARRAGLDLNDLVRGARL